MTARSQRICLWAGVGMAPLFFTVIGTHMRRIEGRSAPLAYVQMIAGGCLV